MKKKRRRVYHLNSNEEIDEEEWEENYEKKANKLGLSKEAKLDEEEKKQVKSLGDNRYLVSSEPIEDRDIEPKDTDEIEEKTSEPEKQEKNLKEEITDKLENGNQSSDISPEEIAGAIMSKLEEKSTSSKSTKKSFIETKETNKPQIQNQEKSRKNPIEKPRNLVRLLSTYKVSLDSSVRKLVKKIRKEGKEHLKKELEKLD